MMRTAIFFTSSSVSFFSLKLMSSGSGGKFMPTWTWRPVDWLTMRVGDTDRRAVSALLRSPRQTSDSDPLSMKTGLWTSNPGWGVIVESFVIRHVWRSRVISPPEDRTAVRPALVISAATISCSAARSADVGWGRWKDASSSIPRERGCKLVADMEGIERLCFALWSGWSIWRETSRGLLY